MMKKKSMRTPRNCNRRSVGAREERICGNVQLRPSQHAGRVRKTSSGDEDHPSVLPGAFAASGLFSTSAHWVTRQVIRRGSPELGSCSSCCPGCHSGDLRVEATSRGNKRKLVATLSTQVRGEASSTTTCALHTGFRERVPQAEARAWRRFGSTRSEGVAVEAQVAQGNDATLRSLRDATRRPPRPRSPLPTWIEDVQAATLFVLDSSKT